MKQKDIVDLIKLIDRCYGTDYASDRDIVNDWFKVLKNYDFKDISNSLDYYMKNYTNYAPKVYDLIRGYKTIDAKKLLDNAKTRCSFCGEIIDIENTQHIDKCRSIEFINATVKRFKNEEINKEKYRNMDQNEFRKYHKAAIDLILKNSNNELELSMWEKTLEIRNLDI